ncbi:hypothetical protein KGF57_002071 [Candida theae]|uniref:Uncharacterized protein n=1 Tax=Candida theae TaxID=1198502 RepID=A0AAD5FZ78_9ASCO|nr:uncharacterized protein KGF57_002071 [Candida theae]KAI5959546.1 hypothetical protein KGF57_002071 [Candida theae]
MPPTIKLTKAQDCGVVFCGLFAVLAVFTYFLVPWALKRSKQLIIILQNDTQETEITQNANTMTTESEFNNNNNNRIIALENTQTENTRTENTRTENTRTENTQTENTAVTNERGPLNRTEIRDSIWPANTKTQARVQLVLIIFGMILGGFIFPLGSWEIFGAICKN